MAANPFSSKDIETNYFFYSYNNTVYSFTGTPSFVCLHDILHLTDNNGNNFPSLKQHFHISKRDPQKLRYNKPWADKWLKIRHMTDVSEVPFIMGDVTTEFIYIKNKQ